MVESASLASRSSASRRKRLPRWVWFAAALLIILAACLTAAPWIFSAVALRNEIEAQIRATTGLDAVSKGRAVLVVLPEPHVNIEAASFADPTGALRVETIMLKGYLRVLPLLAGRLEIASASLYDPQMVIDLDGRPMPSDSAIGRAAEAKPASAQAAVADAARLGTVRLINGSARLKGKTRTSRAIETVIDNINVTLDWPHAGGPGNVSGTLNFGGEKLDIAAWIAKPVELLRGAQSNISLKLGASALSLATSGNLASQPSFQYSGHIEASAPSLRRVFEIAGLSTPLPSPLDDVDLNCDANLDGNNATFANLRLKADGNAFEGALAVQNETGKPVVSGTLATGLLSVTPFLTNLPSALTHDRQWNSEPFDLSGRDFADLDLRVSATRLRIAPFEMQDAALSLMTRNGRLELALGEARAYQGVLKGRASLAFNEGGIDLRANTTLSGLDMSAFSLDTFGRAKWTGLMTGVANVESSGASVSELMHNLQGRAQVNISQGEMEGIDLDQVLRRIERRPLALVTDIHRGRTAYDEGSFGLHIEKGVADIEDGVLQSDNMRLGFGGAADIGERSLNIHAVATPASPSPAAVQAKREGPQFRFDLAGSWDDPAFLPDVESLIRRSGAAAPLFGQKPGVAAGEAPDGDARKE
jgi:AsmA protein